MKGGACRLCFGTGSRYELADPGHHALSALTAREEYLVLVACPCTMEDA